MSLQNILYFISSLFSFSFNLIKNTQTLPFSLTSIETKNQPNHTPQLNTSKSKNTFFLLAVSSENGWFLAWILLQLTNLLPHSIHWFSSAILVILIWIFKECSPNYSLLLWSFPSKNSNGKIRIFFFLSLKLRSNNCIRMSFPSSCAIFFWVPIYMFDDVLPSPLP